MIPAAFDYVKADSVDAAVSALTEDAKILAGGQSLIPLLRMRLAFPELLVDISGVAEMRGIRENGDSLVIGAATTHDEVIHDGLVHKHCPVLAEVTSTVADPAVRHRGTFGGSVAHADPAGDLPAAVLALGASMTVAGPGGRREVAAPDFFVDYLETAVGPDEVLVSVSVPKLGDGWGHKYEKFSRTAQAWALVGALALVKKNGSISEARVGLVNMGPTPVRASAVEQALVGATSANDVTAAAQRATDGANPSSDLHASADYRSHLARVLTGRAVAAAAGL
jgi:carbon-monoxide dehydrogenase medium subunit